MKAFFGSMTGRVFLTLLLGIVFSAVTTQLLAENERQRVIEDYRDLHALDRSEQLITAAETVPASARLAYLAAANRPGIRLEQITDTFPTSQAPSAFATALAARMGGNYKMDSIAVRPAACDRPHVRNSMFGPIKVQWRGVCESINVRLRDGELLRLQVLPPPAGLAHKTDYTLIIGLFLFSIATLAYVVARMTTRPLKQLAQAAKDLGDDINHPPLKLTGASEIRQASAAFNAMQARIRQYIFQRTQMLAAITHDLQTPLTRMRLRLKRSATPSCRNAWWAICRPCRPWCAKAWSWRAAWTTPKPCSRSTSIRCLTASAATPPTAASRWKCTGTPPWPCWDGRWPCGAAWST